MKKLLNMFRKFVIIDSFIGGLRLVPFRDYNKNPILKCHTSLAYGTIRQLKKQGWIG